MANKAKAKKRAKVKDTPDEVRMRLERMMLARQYRLASAVREYARRVSRALAASDRELRLLAQYVRERDREELAKQARLSPPDVGDLVSDDPRTV